MKNCLMLILLLSWITNVRSSGKDPVQADTFRIIEEIPAGSVLLAGKTDHSTIIFREDWIAEPGRPAFGKKVTDVSFHDPSGNSDTTGSSFEILMDKVRYQLDQPGSGWKSDPGGRMIIKDLPVECIFADPHDERPDSLAFSYPDSISGQMKHLQEILISVLKKRAAMLPSFHLESELLSVIFHENWMIDPEKKEFRKEVYAITPVIWQRRRTEEGLPIDEPQTGYPVYYKIRLNKVPLRIL